MPQLNSHYGIYDHKEIHKKVSIAIVRHMYCTYPSRARKYIWKKISQKIEKAIISEVCLNIMSS